MKGVGCAGLAAEHAGATGIQRNSDGQYVARQDARLQKRALNPLNEKLDASPFDLADFALKSARTELQIVLIPAG